MGKTIKSIKEQITKLDYENKALKFLNLTETQFKAEFLKNGLHFEDDKETRDIYKVTLKRGEREYIFNFGQSIAHSGFKLINTNTNKEVKYLWFPECLKSVNQFKETKERQKEIKKFILNKFSLGCLKLEFGKIPNAYDVLACLTKNEVGSFEDFCDDFGYDNDSRKAEETYKAVCKEWDNVKMLWTDEEIEALQEVA